MKRNDIIRLIALGYGIALAGCGPISTPDCGGDAGVACPEPPECPPCGPPYKGGCQCEEPTAAPSATSQALSEPPK